MNYIKKKDRMIEVDNTLINKCIYTYINELALNEYKTIKSIMKASSIKLNIKRNIPLYINSDILLIPISSLRNKDAFYINIINVRYIKNKEFHFNDGLVVNVDISEYRIKELMNKAYFILKGK